MYPDIIAMEPFLIIIVPPSAVHVDTLQWRKVDDGKIPARYEHASFTLGSDLYLFAGAQTSGPLNDIWKYQYCMYSVHCACMEFVIIIYNVYANKN